MTADPPPLRLAWLDQVRAAGIVLVVLGHAILSVGRSGMDLGGAFQLVDRLIYSFHMPLFFLLAGMTHALARRKDLATAARGLFWAVLLPYLVWSTIWYGLKLVFAQAANEAVDGRLIDILWDPIDHLWFLYVLLILRAAWFLIEATESRLLRAAALVLPLVGAFVGDQPHEDIFNRWLLFWAAFYGIGILTVRIVAKLPRRDLALIALAGTALWLAILLPNERLVADGFGAVRTIAAVAASAALIAAIAALSIDGRIGRLVSLVGEASLTIFLTHSIVGAAVRVLLGRVGLATPEMIVLFATLAGLALPIAFHLIVLWLGARTNLPLAAWIGLGPVRRSNYVDVTAPLVVGIGR